MRERGERRMRWLEHARRECNDRNEWRLFCHGHPLVGGVPRNRCQIDIDRLKRGRYAIEILNFLCALKQKKFESH